MKISTLYIKQILFTSAFIFLSYIGQSQVLLNENFSTGVLPVGWSETSVSSDNWEYGTTVDQGNSSTVILDASEISGEYANIDFSDDPDTTSLITPRIGGVSALTTPRLTFEYFSQSDNSTHTPLNKLILDYWNGSAWVNITSIDSLTTLGWTSYDFNISSYIFSTDTVQFRFSAQEGGAALGGSGTSTFDQDLALDEVIVEETPTCPAPSNLNASGITANSADLSWLENGSATSWIVEYGLKGFTVGSGTSVVSSNDTLNVSGLIANASYDFYVQADCGMMDSSFVIGPYTFVVGTNPLAGSYTIDSTIASGGTNFVSFYDFGAALNAFGVSAAVDVTVAANTYNEQLSISKYLGASSTNTLIIDGGDSATISHDQSVRNSTLTLEGASWVTVKNMIVEVTGGTDSYGIQMLDSAHHITIDSNSFISPIVTTTDIAGINISSDENGDLGVGDNAYDVVISYNTFDGGEKGIAVNGNTTGTRNANITINDNVFTNLDDQGIYLRGYDGVIVQRNVINTPNNTGSDAFYIADAENFDISGNYFSGNDLGFDADDLNFDNTVTTNSVISNNMIIGGDDALFMDDVENINIFHNSCYAEDWALKLNDDLNLDIRNNIFYSVDDHAYNSDDGVTHTMDNNIFYTGGTADLVEYGTAVYADLAAFQTGEPTMNATSLQGDPLFIANGIDLHVQGVLANDVGDNTVSITADYDGDTRPLAPSTIVDIGADEFMPATCLAPVPNAASSITSSTALATWIENNSATQWEVEWDTTGYMVGTTMNSMVVNTDTFSTITGLMALSTYDYYVRAICGIGDTSAWSIAETFTTGCAAFSVPYVQNFDGATSTGNFNSTEIPCWQAIGNIATDVDIINSTDHAAPIPTQPYAVELNDGDWSNGDTAMLVSPAFDGLNSGLNRIRFQAAFEAAVGASVDMYVGVLLDPNDPNTFIALDTIDGSDIGGTTNFGEIIIDLTNTALIGSAQYIGIAHGQGTFEAYVDSFVYEQIPPNDLAVTSIVRPVTSCGLTTDSVEVVITNVGSAAQTNFQLGFSVNGVAITPETYSGSIAKGASANYTFTTLANLTGAGDYTIKSYSLLSNDSDNSNDSSEVTINNLGNISSFPYTESFESGAAGWGVEGLTSWELGAPSNTIINSASDGTQAWVTNLTANYGDGELGYVNSPCFDFTNIANPYIDLDIWYDIEGTWDGALLQSSTDNGATWSTVGMENDPINWYNDTADIIAALGIDSTGQSWNGDGLNGSNGWLTAQHALDSLGGQPSVRLRMLFATDGATNNEGMAFDNVVIFDSIPPLPYYTIGTINTEDLTGNADSINVNCRISGTVTGVDRRGGGYEFALIELSTGFQEGITVFEFNDLSNYTSPTEGDSLMIWGTVDQFNGLTQFRPDSILILQSAATIPTADLVNVPNESTESNLIELMDNFVLLDPNLTTSYTMRATNGTDTIDIRIDEDTDVNDSLNVMANAVVAGDTICGLVGIGGQFDVSSPYTEGYQILPSRYSDLIICRLSVGLNKVEESKASFSILPNPTSGEFTIRTNGFNNSSVRIQIRDISGKIITDEILTNANNRINKTMNLNENAKGIYFINIYDGETVTHKKLILK